MKEAIQARSVAKVVAGWAALVCAVALTSCGGGGGDAGAPPFPSPGAGVGTATNLVLQLDKSNVGNSGSDGVAVTVTATDANNNVVAGAPVSIGADAGAVVAANSSVTDTGGKVTASVVVGSENRANRTVTVTATSGSVTRNATFEVIGAKLKSTVVGSQIAPGETGQVHYFLTDVNLNPMRGEVITVTSFGSTSSGTTDINGAYVHSFTAPAAGGVYTISATAGGVSQSDDITVTAVGTVDPVAPGSILSASVEASPSVVSVNSTSTNNQAAIRALFLGANNAPLKNVRVRFDLANDVNSIGGTFTTGNTIVYSSPNGEATSAYVPGTRFSPTDGVTVRACYGYTNAELDNNACPNSVSTTLTVVSEAISVSIGTDKKLIDNTLTYIQEFVVTVVDSSGRAKADVQITPSVDLLRFAKGYWVQATGGWGRIANQDFTDPTGRPWYLQDPRSIAEQLADPGALLIDSRAACWNEDRNRNGVLEAAEDGKAGGYSLAAGGNGNAKLDPAKSDVAISIRGSSKTDLAGKVIVRIEYAKNLGSWLEYKILVSAGGVGGTEGRATWTDVLGVLAADVKGDGEPAFSVSRYGKLAGCADPQ